MWRFVFCLLPTLGFAQVEQGLPNASFDPAFEYQTRAPALAPTEVSTSVFARGLDFAWGIARLPDGRFLVTEKGGAIQMIGADGARLGEVTGFPQVEAIRQGGLLDIAVGPDGMIYWTFAKRVRGGVATAAARGALQGQSPGRC